MRYFLAAPRSSLAVKNYLAGCNRNSGFGFWLFQPRGRLSVQGLALRTAQFDAVRKDPEHFAAMPSEARTPAEVFPDDAQAVIDLANEDAKIMDG